MIDNQIIVLLDAFLIVAIIIDTIITCKNIESMDSILGSIKEIRHNIKEKLIELKESKKENAIDKIKNIENKIDELKLKEYILKVKAYKQAHRLKLAFPTIKSEKITQILNLKIDLKEIKKKIKSEVNKRTRR